MLMEWTFIAESYLDQLPEVARTQVMHALEGLPSAWDKLPGTLLAPLGENGQNLFVLRVGDDLRVLLRRGAAITVIDVVRRNQIDGLRRAAVERATGGSRL